MENNIRILALSFLTEKHRIFTKYLKTIIKCINYVLSLFKVVEFVGDHIFINTVIDYDGKSTLPV